MIRSVTIRDHRIPGQYLLGARFGHWRGVPMPSLSDSPHLLDSGSPWHLFPRSIYSEKEKVSGGENRQTREANVEIKPTAKTFQVYSY